MSHPRYSIEEIVQRGEQIYQRDIRDQVEAQNTGKFLVLDIDTGEYEIDADELAALERATTKHPDGARYILRVGYPTAHRLGGRFTVAKP
jgi:hypothetical protein